VAETDAQPQTKRRMGASAANVKSVDLTAGLVNLWKFGLGSAEYPNRHGFNNLHAKSARHTPPSLSA
jgi:hypothetical protein